MLSYELTTPGSLEFFAGLDRAKREDTEAFALDYWEFNSWSGRRVLDVGCGPGWLTVQYAKGGAQVEAVDLTERAVGIAQRYAESAGITADIKVGNAEALEFTDATFDLVVSSGVLHHTPDVMRAFKECFRVLKPGGTAKITLYRKGVLHSRGVFPFTRLVMQIVGLRHPGADLARTAMDADDFIRQYDGVRNPIGIGMTTREWKRLLRTAGFEVVGKEVHYFPRRFLPAPRAIPTWLHRCFDLYAGTMVYFSLRKP